MTTTPKPKNPMGKTRPVGNPYQVYSGGGWTWKVLKRYSSPEKEIGNPYARAFCHVSSPFCPHGELGDVYVRDIQGKLVSENI